MQIRFGGIASGLDTDQIVRDLMRAERQPLDKLFQRKVQAEWKREGYREVNSSMLRLRNLASDLRFQSTYLAKKATSSNEQAVTVQASGNAQIGSYDIEVKELATHASLVSPDDPGIDLADNFSKFREAVFEGEDGAEQYILQIKANQAAEEYVEITISKNDTLEDVFAKISRNPDLGINVLYDEQSSRVSFTTEGTGEDAGIIFGDKGEGSFFQDVLLRTGEDTDGNNVYLNEDQLQITAGTNAVAEVNGLRLERQSNSFAFNGLNVTLNAETESPVKVTVGQDTDTVVNKIKEFVDTYNEILDEINQKLHEPRYRDYPPLTDEQKEAMSDREVELWEEKAKSGMLRRDRQLSSILTDMRTALTSPVNLEGEFRALHQIGITTGAWHENGKLHLDENKLREALESNPDDVMKLFTSSEEDADGVGRRLYQTVGRGIDAVTNTAGRDSVSYDQSTLGREIRRYEERMSVMEERLIQVENRYWRQFTAMERALHEMNSQSDWLYQQLAQLG